MKPATTPSTQLDKSGRSRCPECGCYVQEDRLKPGVILHWSTGLVECGRQVAL